MMLWLLIGLLVLGGLVAMLAGDGGTIGGLDGGTFAAAVASTALLIYFASALGRRYGGQLSSAVRDIVIWAVIALGLVAGYSYRGELYALQQRVIGELAPPGSTVGVAGLPEGEKAVRIRQRPDGHFVARAQVNGSAVTMLVDTGASSVVLRSSDAQQAGINTSGLTYAVPVETANGTTFAASVLLRHVAVGPIVLERVEALVARPGTLKESLLGMSFLSRLREYSVSGEFLTLRG